VRKTECFTLLAGVVASLFVVTPARAQNTPQKVEQKRAANVQTLYGLLPSAESVLAGGPESAQAISLFAPRRDGKNLAPRRGK
jgi:hypothetical protein